MRARFPYEDSGLGVDARVEDLLSRLDTTDKIGLLFHSHAMVGDAEAPDRFGRPATASLIRQRRINAFLVQGAAESAREMAAWHNALQQVALEHPLGIPVTISTDPRHGVTNNPLAANAAGSFSRWPEPLGIGATADAAIARSFGEVTRREYTAVGIRLALHPQIDLATEPRWARVVHSFSEDAALTEELAVAYVQGLQDGTAVGIDSVAAMIKHFPGGGPQKDGLDPHFADGREQVYPGGRFEEHLAPFIAALRAGASQVMPYYGMPVGLDYEEVGFAFNKSIITGILRERLAFEGIVCTDFGVITGYGDAFPAKAWGVEHLDRAGRIVKALEAGVDQFGGETATDVLAEVVAAGRIGEERLDVSARRLLREKFRMGLFDERRLLDGDAAQKIVGAPEHVAAGLAAQKASLTLLTNGTEGNPTLPLSPGIKVYVEGVAPEAFEGYATVVDRPEDADAAVLRVAAPSYTDPARGFLGSMHRGSLEYDDAFIAHLDALLTVVPTVVDVFLDRPAVLGPLTSAAAVMGSFGTDDRPFVEVLFGDGGPKGRLPFDLPSSMSAVTQSREDVAFDTVDPLFRFGHGLAYVRPTASPD